jgi:hypothetical protein
MSLRRRTDRVEDLVAWLLTCLGLLALLGSVAVGHAAHGAALGRDGAPAPVRAVLLKDAPPVSAVHQRGPTTPPRVPASWTAVDGTVHVVEAIAPSGQRAGSAVVVWLDRAGRVVADPSERGAEALAFGVSAGLTVVALSWAVLAVLWSVVCRMTAACNAAAWAREWASVEPRWRSTSR